jgi:hypothetical protein
LDFLAEFVLKRSQEPNRHVASEAVYDFGCEQLAFIGNYSEKFYTLFRVFPKRERSPLSARKPRSVQVITDCFPRLIDRHSGILISERSIQFFWWFTKIRYVHLRQPSAVAAAASAR